MKDFKFVLIILLIFFGVGIMSEINAYDYNNNNTGIMYQQNNNIVLNENNRYYDYNIDFNLNESYLHYSPVKKSGLLDNLDKDNSKNLVVPDLTGKDYLGDGWYLLQGNVNGSFAKYNIYNGYFWLKSLNDGINLNLRFDITLNENYTFSYELVDLIKSDLYSNYPLIRFYDNTNVVNFVVPNGVVEYNYTGNILTHIRIDSYSGVADTYEQIFKIQLEKGTTATSYTVPYIPPLQIAFNGTNQVEYINPFEEQIIKINDINNVYNIDFELLNTKNPVVFNWNITTNPKIPFVRFYNNETKLLYDFTDIDEINRIGNNLVASQSNFIPVINNVLDIVDMFYTGFQKLFNNDRINTIIDFVKDTWPLLPPNLPLIPIIRGVFS